MEEKQETILVADDDGASRELLTLILEKDGYRIETVGDGREVLERLSMGGVDLVLLDLMMPEVDGYQVLRVMSLDSALHQVPVIVITAVGKKESVQHCISLGAADYLLKPFDPEVVRSRASTILLVGHLREVEATLTRQVKEQKQQLDDLLNRIFPQGITLVNEADSGQLLERFVLRAMEFCRCDAGILYMRTSDDTLKFEVIINKPLVMVLGGTSGKPCPYPPLHIMIDSVSREPNNDLAVTMTAYSGKPIRVDRDKDFNEDKISYFTTKFFNESEVFRATTFLFLPMLNSSERAVGVLELINTRDAERGLIVPFDENQETVIGVFCRLAAQALETQVLRNQLAVIYQKGYSPAKGRTTGMLSLPDQQPAIDKQSATDKSPADGKPEAVNKPEEADRPGLAGKAETSASRPASPYRSETITKAELENMLYKTRKPQEEVHMPKETDESP